MSSGIKQPVTVSHPVQESTVVLSLRPRTPLEREILEQSAIDMEHALLQHAEHLAPGASVSANFDDGALEIDCIMESTSPADLHQRIGELLIIIERKCNVEFGGSEQKTDSPLDLMASATAPLAVCA